MARQCYLGISDRKCGRPACEVRFTPHRLKHTFCSASCRVQAHRLGITVTQTPLHIDKPKDAAAQSLAHKKWAKWRAAKAAEQLPALAGIDAHKTDG